MMGSNQLIYDLALVCTSEALRQTKPDSAEETATFALKAFKTAYLLLSGATEPSASDVIDVITS